MTLALSVTWGHVGTCHLAGSVMISSHLFLDVLRPVCASVHVHFLSCSFAPLLLGRAHARLPAPPSSFGFCAGHSNRVSNSGVSGDRHQPTAEAAGAQGSVTLLLLLARGAQLLCILGQVAQKRLSTNPLVTYKPVLNMKKIQYTKKI